MERVCKVGDEQRPAAILFDLDGTLADSFEGIWRAINRALGERGDPAIRLGWVHTHVGRGTVELMRDALGGNPSAEELKAFGRRFRAIYEADFCAQSPPYPGVRDVLKFVSQGTGGKLAVISNKFEALSRQWLDHWDLAGFFPIVVGAETYGIRKPDPRAILPALEHFAVAPGDALFVGDMTIDGLTGKAAGIPTIGVRSATTSSQLLRQSGMMAVLFDIRDLPPWLVGNGRGWSRIGSGEEGK